MGLEIERKFLVKVDHWQTPDQGCLYRQGYIPTVNHTTVRVRTAGDRGYLTLKGKTEGMGRLEFEYPIPLTEAQELLGTLCEPPLIEKIRYRIPWGDLCWEVDEFLGDNQGLILAEIELPDERTTFTKPDWLGVEVTQDLRYYNSFLARHPYGQWGNFSDVPEGS